MVATLPNPQLKQQPIVLADLIRLFAALLVMFFHLGLQSWYNPSSGSSEYLSDPARYEWLIPYTWFGWVGVQIFFVLSGYIIANSIRGTAVDFLRRRALRIYPTAWICVALSCVLAFAMTERAGDQIIIETLRSIVLWPAGDWIAGVYWTLPVEIAFYVLIALAIATRTSLTSVMVLLTGISGVYWVLEGFDMFPVAPTWLINFLLLSYGANFAFGIAIQQVSENGLRPATVVIGGAACLVSIISIIPKAVFDGAEHGQSFLVPVAIWLLCVVGLAIAIRFNSAISKVIAPQVARIAGIATYPLYLLHVPVGAASMNSLGLVGGMAVAILVSIGVAMYAEPPLRKRMSRRKPGDNAHKNTAPG